jgi:hypothetical protein
MNRIIKDYEIKIKAVQRSLDSYMEIEKNASITSEYYIRGIESIQRYNGFINDYRNKLAMLE